MAIEVIVEIPKGSRNKYETDAATGRIYLDRMLFTATVYPADYGFVPETLAADGDPLDAMVLLEEPTFPGCAIKARPIGVFAMEDEKGPDAKILCVPATDPRWAEVTGLDDLRPHLLEEMRHFFEVYKDLEPSKHSAVGGWDGPEAAALLIEEARVRYKAEQTV